MKTFTWGSQFITGLTEVDQQHEELVNMVNRVGEKLSEHTLTEEFLLTSFRKLTDYAQVHFVTEEKLMTEVQVDVRHIRQHIQQHGDFVNDISSQLALINIDDPEECRPFFEYLVHWLAYHILGTDKNMAKQVQAIRDGETAQRAFEQLEKETSRETEPLLAAIYGLFALVSERNNKLLELNQTLEEKVAARTRELSDANKELEVISITDHLTQLPNRRFAMNQLELLYQESRRLQRPLSCLMVDADNFKAINDTYGHDAGDTVLIQLAKELQHSVRSDDIVCRLGGDEFFIVCPNTDLAGALYLAEHTKSKVGALKVRAGEGYWYGSVSIGAACTNDDICDVDTLMKTADQSVYLAKQAGRNCVKAKQHKA